MKNKWHYPLLKILALLLPMYMVYYWPLHDKPFEQQIKSLWIYTVLGLAIVAIITGICIFLTL